MRLPKLRDSLMSQCLMHHIHGVTLMIFIALHQFQACYSMHIEYQVSYTNVHSKHLPDFLSPILVPLKAYINS